MVAEFGGAVRRKPGGDVVAEGFADLSGVLPLHQTEGDFRGSLRRDHRLGTFADIAADDAVDVAGWARGNLLDQEPVFLAGRNRKPDRLEEGFRRQIELLPLLKNVRRQVLHAVV